MIKSSRSPPFLTYIRTRTFSSSSSRTTSLSKSRLKSLPPSSTHPTPSEFYQSYLEPKTPGLLKGLVHPSSSSKPNPYAWTSIDSWSKLDENGIETLDGMRNQETEELIVPVEIGKPNRGYMEGQTEAQKGKRDGSPGWESIQMPFGLFLDAFVARRIPWTSSSQDIIGYMAQHDLLSSSPTLSQQCPTLPHTSSGPRGKLSNFRSNTWVGPKDSFTPIHRDPYHNLFVQVVGKKRFHIFPPTCAPYLSLSKSATQQNTSLIASEDPLLESDEVESTPNSHLSQAISHPSSHACVLEPGDTLFLPIGWFHCVRSLETSAASVNFWFN